MATPLQQGIGDFVKALGSRGAVRKDAQRSAIRDLDDLARGEILADEFRSRGTLGDDLVAAGVDPNQASILSSVYRAGAGNFQQGTAGLGNLADLALLNRGSELAANPSDIDQLNRIIALRANKPLARTEISGNTAFDPYAAPSAEGLISTPLGESMIAENAAQAAKASRAPAPRASGGGRPERFTAPTQGSIRNAFGKGKGEIDNARYQLFLRWRQDNPDLVNGEQALQQFLNEADVFSINETGSLRPNPNRYRPEPDDGIPVVDSGRGIGDVMAGETYYQDASGQQRPISNRQQYRDAFAVADELKDEARDAIARGADPEKVRQRLKAEILRRMGQ